MANDEKIAIFCVGNKLMLDDGVGPAAYEELVGSYGFPENVELFDVGCMSFDMIMRVDEFDYIITIDAVDGTGEPAGTVFEFAPDDMARHTGAMASLHDLKLIDLFDAAALMGYSAEGRCFGVQALNREPVSLTIGLTEPVHEALPLLVDTVIADLVKRGVEVRSLATGEPIPFGHHHTLLKAE